MKDSKQKILDELYERYQEEFYANSFVPGYGDVCADIMFIGEAPGRDEIKQQKPFVGKAGARFEDILFELGLERNRIFLSNAIKYGLRTDIKKTGRNANRPARASEIRSSRKYLLEEIGCIAPKLIVTLGMVPLKMILDIDVVQMSMFAGKTLKTQYGSLFAMFHPAAMIYNPNLKERYDEDIKILKEIIKDI